MLRTVGEFYFITRMRYFMRKHFISHKRHSIGEKMKENKLIELSLDFSVSVINVCDTIKGHRSLIDQIERSSTSIGANIHEANYAHSKLDFIAKLQIALKECFETEYWLQVLDKTSIIDSVTANLLRNKCGTIRRLLISSINTAKKNNS